MTSIEKIVKEVRAAFENEPRINLHHYPVQFEFNDGIVTLTGELATLAAKKLAVGLAATVPGVSSVKDRLRVKPAEAMEDGALCDLVFNALLQESAFNDFTLRALINGSEKGFRGVPRAPSGNIELVVHGGVVTLRGEVESYAHKALAEVLAWWRRGTRDVANHLGVAHAMSDPDGEMTDALRMLLEKDKLLNAPQIRGLCRDFTVTLNGAVAKAGEKELAESDAWYLLGVTEVVNRLQVLE